MAIRIFVEFVARDVAKIENVGQSSSDPEELANLSFKLAGAFQKVDSKLSGERDPNAPKFEFEAGDIAAWNK
jgi:hypothetical protein